MLSGSLERAMLLLCVLAANGQEAASEFCLPCACSQMEVDKVVRELDVHLCNDDVELGQVRRLSLALWYACVDPARGGNTGLCCSGVPAAVPPCAPPGSPYDIDYSRKVRLRRPVQPLCLLMVPGCGLDTLACAAAEGIACQRTTSALQVQLKPAENKLQLEVPLDPAQPRPQHGNPRPRCSWTR